LLLLHMNKTDQCRELVKMLEEHFSDSDWLALINAALLYKEKKISKSEELLKTFAKDHPTNSVRVQLCLSQLYLNKGDINATIEALQNIEALRNKPKMVATLASLYEQTKNINGAVKVLDDYCNWLASQKQRDDELYVQTLKNVANFKLKHKKFKEASDTFSQIIKFRPSYFEALAGLVISFSQFDAKQALKYETKIPVVAGEVEVDAEALENLVAPRIGTVKKEEQQKTEEVVKKDKKKKKKKKKHLKNVDPSKPVDPERWIKLQLRSYYKKKTKKGKLEKGAQGTSSSDKKLTASLDRSKSADGKQEMSSTTTSSPPTDKQKLSSSTDKPSQPSQPQPQKAQSSSKKKKSHRRG